MSIYPNVTEQDLINLAKVAEQQKDPGACKYKRKKSEQSWYTKLAESIEITTKCLSKTT